MKDRKTTFTSEGTKVVAKHGCKTINMTIPEAKEALSDMATKISEAENWEPGLNELLRDLKDQFKKLSFITKRNPRHNKDVDALRWFFVNIGKLNTLSEILANIESFLGDKNKMENILKITQAEFDANESQHMIEWAGAVKQAEAINSFIKMTKPDGAFPLVIPKDPTYDNRTVNKLLDQIEEFTDDFYDQMRIFASATHKGKAKHSLAEIIGVIVDEN